jgi:hypothetical protein
MEASIARKHPRARRLSPTYVLYPVIDEGHKNARIPREKVHLPGD